MIENIFAIIMTIIAIGAGIFGLWMENGKPEVSHPEKIETGHNNHKNKEN